MIELAALVLAASDITFRGSERKLAECVVQNSIALGWNNAEPAESVIRAANGRCAREWRRAIADLQVGSLGARAAGPMFEKAFEERTARELKDLEDRIYSVAFEALIERRGANSQNQ